MRRIRTRWTYLTLLNIVLAVLVACSSATDSGAASVETVRPEPTSTGIAGEPLPTPPLGFTITLPSRPLRFPHSCRDSTEVRLSLICRLF